MPLTPLRMLFQAVAMSLPTGEMMPMPVTTTRRLLMDRIPSWFGKDQPRGTLSLTLRRADPAHHTGSDVANCRNENCAEMAQLPISLRGDMGRVCFAPPRGSAFLGVGLDVIDSLLHGGDLLGFLVGNFGFEFLF